MSMFDTLRLMFPRGRAWRLVVDRMLVRYLRGIAAGLDSVRTFFDEMYFDLFPETTRLLPSWDAQFAFVPGTLTDPQRRERLAGAWGTTGRQDPRYITDTLQAHGFPVYTHEWWELTAWGVPRPRDPRDHLLPEYGGTDVDGLLLANLYYTTVKTGPYAQAGEPLMQAGEPFAQAGNFGGYTVEAVGFAYCGPFATAPDGSEYFTHPSYMYIGGETFPDVVAIPLSRRVEFETLVRRICPGYLWIVLRVQYT